MNKNSFGSRIAALILFTSGIARLPAADNTSAPPPAAPPPAAGTNFSLSAMALPHRAPWQQRLTLGPGDLLNLSLFEMPDTAQLEVPIGPDGRITVLQARDVMAAGLTIDELRSRLDEALSKYYQTPRTIVTPAAFHSKKYLVLGAVVNKGVYTFDRPVTVIEALARAGGLETGLYDQKTVELADLQRSFLVRNGQRVTVDFERLFQQGDLSQNVPLEPGDYLYFASGDANQVYVLGEVGLPGIVTFAPKTTVISAIAARGGFTPRAFKSRVLVVRGSLNHPQTFVVDSGAILGAKATDFKLQPKDIVYVSFNPWVKAEDILDTAARAFLQGMIVQWTTRSIGPLITSPLL
jgi:protein involved in polysaccharide export with SLBB domain